MTATSDGKGSTAPRSKLRRLAALLLVGCGLVAGAMAYRHYWYARPMGGGPAGPAVPREAFERVWTDRKVLLVGFGDSVTAGFGASPGRSYFKCLSQNPKDESPDMQGICLAGVLPNLTTVNLALSGSTSIELLKILLPKLEMQAADVFGIVVLTTGGNDVIHNYGRAPPREGAMYGAPFKQAETWIRNFETRLNTIIDGITAKFPGGCRIFLADIYDPTDGIGDVVMAGLPAWPDGLRIHAAYNSIITRCAERHESVHLVNIREEFLGHGIHCLQFWNEHYHRDDHGYWYYDNLEDPNDRGYDAIRRLFLIEMAMILPPLLKDPARPSGRNQKKKRERQPRKTRKTRKQEHSLCKDLRKDEGKSGSNRSKQREQRTKSLISVSSV